MKYRDRIQKMEKDIGDVMKMEAEEKVLRIAELQMNKAKNILQNPANVNGQPERTWFQTKKERMLEQGTNCELTVPLNTFHAVDNRWSPSRSLSSGCFD
jgi:hypothetical protein